MIRAKKENFKTYILLILVIGSFVQLGILWGVDAHRLPFNFISAFLRYGQTIPIETDKLKQDMFNPYRVIVSQGFDESHWLLSEEKSGDSTYSMLISDLKSYLKDICDTRISGKPLLVNDADKQWNRIIQSKVFIFEYKTNIKLDVLTHFLINQSYNGEEPSGVYKIAVSPWEDINENINTVYILDGEFNNAKLYKFTIPITSDKISKSGYQGVFTALDRESKEGNLRRYSLFTEVNPGENAKFLFPVRKDIPVVMYGDKYESISSICSYIPQVFEKKSQQEVQELKEKAGLILGSEKHRYVLSEDIYGNTVFKNPDSIYKIFSDEGILEYRYLSENTEPDKGSDISAVSNAMEFIGKTSLLPQGAKIYLSGIKYDEKDRYRITFDYSIGSKPIFLNYCPERTDLSISGKVIRNAITIEANSKRVLSCWWVIRNFEAAKEGKKQYNIFFSDFMDLVLSKDNYAHLKNDESFSVKDINISYVITKDMSNGQNIGPSWVILTEKGDFYPVRMEEKKAY